MVIIIFNKSKDEKHPSSLIYEEVMNDELNIITKPDRRKFKEEEILIRNDKLKVFKRGFVNFIIGGSILRLQNPNAHYAYVIHTNTQKDAHKRIELILHLLIEQLNVSQRKDNKELIKQLINESYSDIEKSIKANGYNMPDFDTIQSAFFNAIDDGLISPTIINSDRDILNFLDEDSGEIKLRTPFSIIIGGQALDRGVTIKNLIGFYYGRNPKTMQQDTVLQHSRMFGYREKELLAVTRFYTTHRIHENMTKITEIDSNLRSDLLRDPNNNGIYFIHGDEKGRVIPCSPSKIGMSNITILNSGKRILPIGFTPIAKTYASRISKNIEKEIAKHTSLGKKEAILVPTQILSGLISQAYSAIRQDEGAERFISEERFLSIFKYLSEKNEFAYLIFRANRNISKFKGPLKNLYTDSPDSPQDELRIAKAIAIDKPALILLNENKNGIEESWKGGEFWWPIIVVQSKFPKTIFSLDEPGGKLSKRK